MQNFTAIRPAVRNPLQKTHGGGCITPPPSLHGRGLKGVSNCILQVCRYALSKSEGTVSAGANGDMHDKDHEYLHPIYVDLFACRCPRAKLVLQLHISSGETMKHSPFL